MVSEKLKISSSARKFDETIVTGQPLRPRNPVVAMPVSKPEAIGLGLLKALIESDVDRGVAALLGMTKVAGYLPAA